MRSFLLLLAACTPVPDPLEPLPPGTQAGDEGDEDGCLHHRETVTDLEVAQGSLPMSPADFIAVLQTPVSGPITLPDGPETLSLASVVTGDVLYAWDEPAPGSSEACLSESYFVPAHTTLQAGQQLDLAFDGEAWGFQAGHAWVGVELPLDELTGTLAPQQLDPADWDQILLRASGGSTDGVWTFNMDWRAERSGPDAEEEDIARVTLRP